MSLIIEALKKARDDAVRRQAAARGLPLAPVPKLESKSRWLSLALIPLVAALVICIMLLIDVYTRFPDRPEPSPVAQEAEPSRPSAPANAGASPAVPDDSSPGDRATASVTPATLREPSAALGPRAENRPSPTPSMEAAEEQPEPTASPPAVENADGSDLVATGQARLEGGHLVDLGGIAWSESDPYALINGQVVGVGELVRAYRVTSITPNAVVLEKDEDRVVLRLE